MAAAAGRPARAAEPQGYLAEIDVPRQGAVLARRRAVAADGLGSPGVWASSGLPRLSGIVFDNDRGALYAGGD